MRKVRVSLGPRSHDILVGEGLLSRLGRLCAPLGDRCVVISDTRVAALHAEGALGSLRQAGLEPSLWTVPPGESTKSLHQFSDGLDHLASLQLDRRSLIIVLGGGVVGDLAGFLAACYLRGLRLVQVPTTLLAQVDSSVGGKTGINLPEGKNLVGAFHQPRLVLCDTGLLATLPDREFRAGLAEVVKYGIIRDARLFSTLEREHADLRQPDLLERIIARCCRIKAEVVAEDEREGGLRAILNFGHTVGHALEALTRYRTYLHGEAVSIGQVAATRLSVRHAGLSPQAGDRITRLLSALGLPVSVSLDPERTDRLLAAMRKDKKTEAGIPRFVLAERIGKAVPGFAPEESLLREVLTSLADRNL